MGVTTSVVLGSQSFLQPGGSRHFQNIVQCPINDVKKLESPYLGHHERSQMVRLGRAGVGQPGLLPGHIAAVDRAVAVLVVGERIPDNHRWCRDKDAVRLNGGC